PVDDPQNDPHREVGRCLFAAILSCQFGILEYTLRNYVPEQVDPSWGQLGWSLQRVIARLPRCLADFRGFRDRSSLSSTRVVDKRKIVTNSSRYYTCNVWTMYDISCPVYIRKT